MHLHSLALWFPKCYWDFLISLVELFMNHLLAPMYFLKFSSSVCTNAKQLLKLLYLSPTTSTNKKKEKERK